MAHNPAWHAEYLTLENAENAAREGYRLARKALDRKHPPVNAKATYDTSLEAFRSASKSRFDFEMAATTVVNIATLPVNEWAAALR